MWELGNKVQYSQSIRAELERFIGRSFLVNLQSSLRGCMVIGLKERNNPLPSSILIIQKNTA